METCCYNCELLKLKLQEVSSELSSACEVIKILQEEENSAQRTPEKPCVPQLNREVKQASTEDSYTNWTVRKPGRKCAKRNYVQPRQVVFPIHANRYNALCTLIEPQIVNVPTPHNTMTTINKNSEINRKKCNTRHSNTQKIIIIGDSHAKGCAANIKHILGKTAVVTGYVSPGSKLENITNIANNEINNLTKKDIVVIWGGSNDITKNESDKCLKHLLNFVGLCTNTNVAIVGTPKRHDLLKTSCVNEEVEKFNRKLLKKMRVFENAKVIDSVSQRECYTKRGLHLNSIGKEQMAYRIIEHVKSFLVTNITPPPNPLPWKEVPSAKNPVNSEPQGSVTATRASG